MADGDCTSTVDKEYYSSYGDVGVHELMIRDKPRTEAYREFIAKNVKHFKDKVVLDVGAGTGILSLFAARSGAKKIYSVEASDIADLCKDIVAVNKYEHVITVLKNEVEKVELPEKVDVIISEWMGFYLLHESMLESVLFARDKWLKDDGIMLPSHACIYACPVNMREYCKENLDCWTDVYDFDFTPLYERKVAALLQQPLVTHLKADQLLSESKVLAKFDLKHMKASDMEEIEEQLNFDICKGSDIHGFAFWFDVYFAPSLGGEIINGETSNGKMAVNSSWKIEDINNAQDNGHIVSLRTGPDVPETHWKQTVCFLPGTLSVVKSDEIFCKLSLSQDPSNKRHYNISVEMLEGFEFSDSDLDDDEEEDGEEHPVPCDCNAAKCKLIRAIMEKYDAEQTELEMEAEFTDVSAEVQAAQTLDADQSLSESDLSLKDDSYSNNNKDDK